MTKVFEKLEKLQLVWLALILALGLIIGIKIGTSNFSREGITVTGSANHVVQSDTGTFNLEIVVRKPARADAYKTVRDQVPVVLEYIKDKGFDEKEIEVKPSSGYYTYKTTPNGNSTNEIAFYNLAQPITVTASDVEKIKELALDIQDLSDKGIEINANSPEYYYSKLNDLKVSLLEEATKDAKQRASAMLKATHNRVGRIQSVKMGVFQITSTSSTDVSDYGINDTSSIEKKITAVANVVFHIK